MKQLSTSMDNIHVAIRVRPLLQENDTSVWTCKGNVIYPTESKVITGSSYCVDKIFDVDSNTEEVYNSFIRHIICSTMDGFNGTVFAYGQTSSGKTHTMHGDRNDPGIIPRAIHDIFQIIQNTPDREYLLRVSYLEIYNEKIKDLLNPSHDNLKIHMKNNEFYVDNLTEDIVLNPEEVANLLKKGDDFRHIGQTNMNEHSSRSHTIFRMIIESREKNNNNEANNNSAIKVSHLNLVDLAGSERVSQIDGDAQQVKEGVHINLSLFTLGVVIAKLSEGNDNTHIPYRDSKLTRILQPSLGGNARTAIICTITPSGDFQEETHSTLKFAIRAKTIQNKPEVNEIVSDEALLKKYRKEINSLKKQLQEIQTQDRLTELSKIKEHNIAMMKKLEEKEQHEAKLMENLEQLKAIPNEYINKINELEQYNELISKQLEEKEEKEVNHELHIKNLFNGIENLCDPTKLEFVPEELNNVKNYIKQLLNTVSDAKMIIERYSIKFEKDEDYLQLERKAFNEIFQKQSNEIEKYKNIEEKCNSMINLLNEKETEYKEKIEKMNNENNELLNKLKMTEENYLKLVEENHANENAFNLILKLNNLLSENKEKSKEMNEIEISNIKMTIDNLKQLISNTNIFITNAIQTDEILLDPEYIKKLEKNIESMTDQINDLKKENGVIKKNKNETEVLLKEKEDVIYQLKINNDEFKKKLDHSDDAKQKADNEINELLEKIESLKNEHKNKDLSIQQLQTEINKLNNDKTIDINKIKHLEQENKKIENFNEDQQKSIDKLTKEIEEDKKKIIELNEMIKQYEKTIKENQNSHEKSIETMKIEHEERIEDLTTQYKQSSENVTKVEQQVFQLEEQVVDYQEKFMELQNVLAEQKECINERDVQINDLIAQVDSSSNEIQTLQNTIKNLHKQIGDYEKKSQ